MSTLLKTIVVLIAVVIGLMPGIMAGLYSMAHVTVISPELSEQQLASLVTDSSGQIRFHELEKVAVGEDVFYFIDLALRANCHKSERVVAKLMEELQISYAYLGGNFSSTDRENTIRVFEWFMNDEDWHTQEGISRSP